MTASLKSALRKEKIDARRKLHADEWQRLSAQVAERIKSRLTPSAIPLAIYYPVRGEVDVLPLMQWTDVCLPVTQPHSRELVFRKAALGQHLEKNIHGIMQPAESAPQCQPDIIIVPVVAFDRKGFRIGYGGGYYDTTLALLRKKGKIAAIGTAFSFQEVPTVPMELFDARLDMIITDKENLEFT